MKLLFGAKAVILDTENALKHWLIKLMWLENSAITLVVFLLQSRQA
jgi:hypothetical protein